MKVKVKKNTKRIKELYVEAIKEKVGSVWYGGHTINTNTQEAKAGKSLVWQNLSERDSETKTLTQTHTRKGWFSNKQN